ncbi:hypothetical protein GUITHDRAFT_136603 [Guillardia theta CCMP2712]|uniref:Uncharacterized protein n=1 Tax=Guillardia theta (strain CCMP2712) TaxID=905079 RepID=L1JJI3_GUITC|nr:hypothetical protein GUITHDRAFT_136603 [Guillardia theta CCMP2712]EKX48472.1 hypothetical protein GUITHDRAFT_136603 [Guillardia theta CCMP2712]|eukprot:XP_005835452.1 hypothetical protein GUITHDRAFT_136603 [Guillardia theta CCMP2712]
MTAVLMNSLLLALRLSSWMTSFLGMRVLRAAKDLKTHLQPWIANLTPKRSSMQLMLSCKNVAFPPNQFTKIWSKTTCCRRPCRMHRNSGATRNWLFTSKAAVFEILIMDELTNFLIRSIVVDKRDAVKHDEGLKEHFEELNFYRSIIAKEEELKQQEGQLTEESGPSPIKKKPDGFFIEQEIDSKGRIRVKQDSVLMPSIDSQHDLFMVDGVLVNALGEEVQPVKGSQDHSQVVAPQTMSATRISREEDGSNSDDDLSLPWQVPAEVAEKVKDKSRTDVMEEYNKRLQMQATQKALKAGIFAGAAETGWHGTWLQTITDFS